MATETETNFNSVKEAMDWIEERYNFKREKKAYPILEFLDEQQRLNFAASHCLLHIQKSLPIVFCEIERIVDQKPKEIQDGKTALAKIMVNIIAMTNEISLNPGLLGDEFKIEYITSAATPRFYALLNALGKIAEVAEANDHGKDFRYNMFDFQRAFGMTMQIAVVLYRQELIPFLNFLPSVMKSK